jgi:lipoprotein-anchoring transpeptidase ErfK/SrfK
VKRKSLIAVAIAVALLLIGAVAVYAYDNSREDRIARGVTVAGVDVGGMSATTARRALRREVAAPLERPVAVTYHGRRFTLSAEDAGVRADVGGMVDDALRATRAGSIVTRVARDLTGGEENAQIQARVTYSRRAVAGLVKRVERSVNRPARDARVDFPSLKQVKEQNGVRVEDAALRDRVERALTSPSGRTVTAPGKVTKPKVTSAQLANRYPVILVLERSAFKLSLYKRLRQAKSFTVAVGQVGLETPAGLYHIQDKAVNPAWHVPNSSWAGSLAGTVVPPGPENPIKARWMGIFAGAGIHGTDETWSLGHAVSHGCVRMAIPDVEALYPQVPVGTPIYIA